MNKYIIFLFLSGTLTAQVEPKDVKSPNAGSFERYGKYNVSLSSGTVDVNIPLHQIELKDRVLDLGLDFNTSGLKISQPAGSTGVNWSLQIPGIITRKVNGEYDEGKTASYIGGGGSTMSVTGNHFYAYSDLNYPNIETQVGLESFNNSRHGTLEQFIRTSKDLQPDVFSFNFMGKTGIFFLGQDGTWKVQSEDNLKIIINEEDFFKPFNFNPPSSPIHGTPPPPISIGKITIIDDIGNQYIFGSNHNSIEFTVNSFFQQNNPLYSQMRSTAWYLNEVRNRLGNTLFTCSYLRGKPIANFYNNVNDQAYIYEMLSGSLISPVYLSSINTKDEEIIFSYSDRSDLTYSNDANLEYKFQKIKTNNGTTDLDPQWPERLSHLYTNFNQNTTSQLPPNVYSNWKETSKLLVWNKLDKITIKTNYLIKKEINFEYINKSTERLFLTKVKFSNNTYGQISEYDYKIEYNSGYNTAYQFQGTLPQYLWTGTNIFDSYSSPVQPTGNCGINCSASENNDALSKMGALLKITYPTKGFTYFNFEQNDFSKYLQANLDSFLVQGGYSNTKTGGLRIKSISNFSNVLSEKREITTYEYLLNDEHSSSGILARSPFLSNSNKLSYYGPPITYSRVIEGRTDEKGKQKTEYIYSNYDTAPYYNDVAYIKRIGPIFNNNTMRYIDRSFLRGKLLQQKIYDANNVLLNYYNYIYNFDNLENRYVRSFGYSDVPSDLIKIYYGDAYLEKEIKREYFNGKEIKTETIYNKTDYPYQTLGSTIFTGSNRLNYTSSLSPTGEITKNETEYLFNCNNENCSEQLFGLPKTIKQFKNSTLLFQNEITYKTINSNPKSLVVDEYKKIFPGNINLPEKIKFTKYDSYGNIIEFRKENANPVSIIYNSKGTYPLVKLEGATYSDLTNYLVNIQKPYISNSTDAQNNLADPLAYANAKDVELRGYFTEMSKNLPNAFVTSYTYDSYNRLKTITTPIGIVEFYEYDNIGRLINIKDNSGKLLKEFNYNYKTDTSGTYPYLLEEITNDEYKFSYFKSNCSVGQIADVYNYIVPQGKYKSLISSTDLYQKVVNDANLNGQNYANNYGNCINANAYYGLIPLSTIKLQTSSLYLNNTTVSGYFVFNPVSLNSNSGSYIARVPDNMIPSVQRDLMYHEVNSGVDRYWSFRISTNGYVFAIYNGTAITTSTTVVISSFQYQK